MSGSWQPDPTGRHQYRWWDGERWTDNVSDAGQTSVDPVGAPPEESAAGAGAGPAGEPTAAMPPVAPVPPPGAGAGPQPGMTAGGPPAGGPPPSGAQEGGGPNKGLIAVIAVVVAALIGGGAFLLLGGDDDDDVTTSGTTTSTSELAASTTSSTPATTTAVPTTTTAATTTTGGPTTTVADGEPWPGSETGSFGAGEASFFDVDLETGQAFRYRAREVPGTESDLVISVVAPVDQLLPAAASSTSPTFSGIDEAGLRSIFSISAPWLADDQLIVYQTDSNFAGTPEADWFFGLYDGTVQLAVSEYEDGPGEFELQIEPGDQTGLNPWDEYDNEDFLDNPLFQQPFFTDPDFYGS